MVFVNVSGSCLALCEQDAACQAVLQCFYPGAEGGHALAGYFVRQGKPKRASSGNVLCSDDDLPPFRDYAMENRTYKFFKGKPLYPFGHGLSYSKVTESWLDGRTAHVVNEGPFDGLFGAPV